MKTLHLECSQCESKYILEFDEDAVMDSPETCPFCGEEIDELDLDDYDEEKEEEDE